MLESFLQWLASVPALLTPEVSAPIHATANLVYNSVVLPVILFSLTSYALIIVGLRLREAPRRARVPYGKLPRVTVQIPTRDDLVAIRCAKRCLAFDYPKEKLQILIGDDSTESANSERIDRFAKENPRVTVVRRGTMAGFKAGNLNSLLRHSTGEVVLIFDSDFVAPRRFLKRIVEPFVRDPKVAGVQAKWAYLNIADNAISKFAAALIINYHRLLAPLNNRLGVPLLFGSAQALRRSVLVKLKGWQEWSVTEDVEFTLRAMRAGYRFEYLQDLESAGEVPFTLAGLSKQQKRWAFGNLRVFIQHGRWILSTSKLNLLQKWAICFTLLGYFSAPIMVVFLVAGVIGFGTTPVGPANVTKFVTESSVNFFVTSGFLFATVVALALEKRLSMAGSVILTSVTSGVVVALHVFSGLIKGLHSTRMEWQVVEKRGNLPLGVPRAAWPVLPSGALRRQRARAETA